MKKILLLTVALLCIVVLSFILPNIITHKSDTNINKDKRVKEIIKLCQIKSLPNRIKTIKIKLVENMMNTTYYLKFSTENARVLDDWLKKCEKQVNIKKSNKITLTKQNKHLEFKGDIKEINPHYYYYQKRNAPIWWKPIVRERGVKLELKHPEGGYILINFYKNTAYIYVSTG